MNKRVIAITGGIASGKSTVTGMFRKLGGYVVSADDIAHEIIKRGQPAYRKIISMFGSGLLDKKGEIDRRALGRRVFPDPAKRKKLEKLTHPLILQRMKEGIKVGRRKGKFVVLEIPLLFESRLERLADVNIAVFSSKKDQLKRLCEKGYSRKDALLRISSQMPLFKKILLSDYTVFNTSTKAIAFEQVKAIAAQEKLILR